MNNKNLLLFLLLFYLAGCTSGEEKKVQEIRTETEAIDSLNALQEEPVRKAGSSTADTLTFEVAFQQFFNALQSADTTKLNQFIHPQSGLWVIEQPGAMPKMTRITDIRLFKREYQGRSFFTITEELKSCELLEEPFPAFDCAVMEGGKTGYAKDGCFVWKPEKFKTSGYWNYASLSETEIKQVNASFPNVLSSVLHTQTSFEFHFGYLGGHWRVLFAKIIYPCSA